MNVSMSVGGLKGPLASPRSGFFPAQAYDWDGMATPAASSSTGTVSGKAVQKPIRVTRAEDRASPVLAQNFLANAVVGGTAGVTVAADYPNTAGTTQSATFALGTPHVVRIAYSAHAGGGDDVTEEVSFIYQQIVMTHSPSGQSTTATVQ